MERPLDKTIEAFMGQFRWQVNDKLSKIEALLPHAADVLAVLESAAHIADGIQQKRPAEPLVRQVLMKLLHLLDIYGETLLGLESQLLESEHTRGEKERELAAAQALIERRDSTQRTVDRLRSDQGQILDSFSTFARGSVLKLDELLEQGRQIESTALRLVTEAEEILPDLTENAIGLDQRISALSARTAPILAREFNLSSKDLAEVELIMGNYDALRSEFGGIKEFMVGIERELRDAQLLFQDWSQRWMELREKFKAAEILLPLLVEQDLFALAETTSAEVDQKRRLCGNQSNDVHRAISSARASVERRLASIQTTAQRLDERFEELGVLSDRTKLSGYDELDSDAQEFLRSLVLCYSAPQEVLTLLKLSAIIQIWKRKPMDPEATTSVVGSWPLFVRRKDPRFKLYGLSARGQYWLTRWQRDCEEQARAVTEARERYGLDKQAEEATAAEERRLREVERTTQIEARRRERDSQAAAKILLKQQKIEAESDPLRIHEKLGDVERNLLRALGLLPEKLSRPRDAVLWSRDLAALIEVGLLQAKPLRAANALVRLLIFQPDLFAYGQSSHADGVGQRFFRLSITGETAARTLFFAPSDKTMDHLERLMQAPAAWPASLSSLRNEIQEALFSVYVKLPEGRYSA